MLERGAGGSVSDVVGDGLDDDIGDDIGVGVETVGLSGTARTVSRISDIWIKGRRGTCVSEHIDHDGVDGDKVLGPWVEDGDDMGNHGVQFFDGEEQELGWVNAGTMRTRTRGH